MNDTDNRMQELALRRAAFSELLGCATDWQARCLAAEAERDALAAELVALRAGLPRWRKGADSRLVLTSASGKELGAVTPFDGRWMVEVGRQFWRENTRKEAMQGVSTALGLPPCEVEGE